MQILFLSQVLPYPLDAGPKARSYYVLRHLVQSHQVTLLTFVRDTDRPQDIAHLSELCHAVHTVPMQRSRLRDVRFLVQSLVGGQPFLITRDQVPAMTHRVQQLAREQQFDAVHADQLWMAQYALAARAVSPQSRLILDQHNAVHLIPKRLANDEANFAKKRFLNHEFKQLTRYEASICRHFDQVVWVTKEDWEAVAALPGSTARRPAATTVIPICADPTQVQPVNRTSSKPRVTFLGGLHWPPNAQGVVWFAQHVFPAVKAEIPEATFTVIGKNPPAGLDGAGIEVTGYVTDPTPYLAETAAFIVPLHAGGGMRVKILDAWSWGLPIVSTTIGAEGIDTQPEHDMLIADNPEDFARQVIRLLTNPALAQQLAQNGRKTVSEKYDWQTTYAAWDNVYAGLQNGRSGA